MKIKLVKDPIWGYIELDELDRMLVDTAAFQRLRRIRQLPFVHLVYPGAMHTRFDHSLGCFYLASEFAKHMGLDEYWSRVLRYAALLHDIGHTPYSHLLETILIEGGLNHESMGIRIIKEDPELSSSIERAGVDLNDVLDVLEKKRPESSIISGSVDVDKLDFLMRDSYFTGASYGIVDAKRIIRLMSIVDGRVMVNVRGLGAIEELAIARFQSFMNIYFHHAARAAQALFLRGFKKLDGLINFASMSIEEYISHDDYTIWCMMKSNERTKMFIKRLERRDLPKRAYEDRIEHGKLSSMILSEPCMKAKIEEEIAEMAGVPLESVWVDTPYVPPLPILESQEILFYEDGPQGAKQIDIKSPLLKSLGEVYNIVRVYTEKEYRAKVQKAAMDYFQSLIG